MSNSLDSKLANDAFLIEILFGFCGKYGSEVRVIESPILVLGEQNVASQGREATRTRRFDGDPARFRKPISRRSSKGWMLKRTAPLVRTERKGLPNGPGRTRTSDLTLIRGAL